MSTPRSCVDHPEQAFLRVRRTYVLICEGDLCAAALLDRFEYETNGRLTLHGPEADPWIRRSQTELSADLYGCFERKKVGRALALLIRLGLIEKTFGGDPTPQYRLDVEHVNAALRAVENLRKTGDPCPNRDKSLSQSGQVPCPKRDSSPYIEGVLEEPRESSIDDFHKFIARYPKHSRGALVGSRDKAWREWLRVASSAEQRAEILAGLDNAKRSDQWLSSVIENGRRIVAPRFIPSAERFLADRQWLRDWPPYQRHNLSEGDLFEVYNLGPGEVNRVAAL